METQHYCLILSFGRLSAKLLSETEIHKETAQVIRFNDGVFEECITSRLEVGEGDKSSNLLWVDVNASTSERETLAEEFIFGDILSKLASIESP